LRTFTARRRPSHARRQRLPTDPYFGRPGPLPIPPSTSRPGGKISESTNGVKSPHEFQFLWARGVGQTTKVYGGSAENVLANNSFAATNSLPVKPKAAGLFVFAGRPEKKMSIYDAAVKYREGRLFPLLGWIAGKEYGFGLFARLGRRKATRLLGRGRAGYRGKFSKRIHRKQPDRHGRGFRLGISEMAILANHGASPAHEIFDIEGIASLAPRKNRSAVHAKSEEGPKRSISSVIARVRYSRRKFSYYHHGGHSAIRPPTNAFRIGCATGYTKTTPSKKRGGGTLLFSRG